MDSFFTKAAVSMFFLSGLILASFSLFLHPMGPMEFLGKVFSIPADTFPILAGYVQAAVFWISAGCTVAGIVGMLLVAVQRWRKRRFFLRADAPQSKAGDGEENWMFL